jgi:hypothetical protein
VFDIKFLPNFMNYKGYYGRFEIHNVLSSLPPDSYLVTGTGILPATDLPLLSHALTPIRAATGTSCPLVKCPLDCKNEFVKSEGCLVCLCAAHEAHNDVVNTPLMQAG